MKYLHLRFENAGLISSTDKYFVRDSLGQGENVACEKGKVGGHDMETPIPYTLLSNILHKLCGETPVPTKRQTFLERIPMFDEIAKNSFVKYDIEPVMGKFGIPTNSETFRTSKYAFNAHQNVETTFQLADGSMLKIPGRYSWDYLKRACGSNEVRKTLFTFLTKLIGTDCTKLTMTEMVKELSKHWGDDDFNAKVDAFLEKNPLVHKELKAPWERALFGKESTGANTSYNTRTPLLYTNGLARITFISGDIICPIDNEEVIQAIRENCGTATVLENGIIYVSHIGKHISIPDFETSYRKIFE